MKGRRGGCGNYALQKTGSTTQWNLPPTGKAHGGNRDEGGSRHVGGERLCTGRSATLLMQTGAARHASWMMGTVGSGWASIRIRRVAIGT